MCAQWLPTAKSTKELRARELHLHKVAGGAEAVQRARAQGILPKFSGPHGNGQRCLDRSPWFHAVTTAGFDTPGVAGPKPPPKSPLTGEAHRPSRWRVDVATRPPDGAADECGLPGAGPQGPGTARPYCQ